MKISTKEIRASINADYVQRMNLELGQVQREKIISSNRQAESTQKILAMTEEELEAYRSRPLPVNEQARTDKNAERINATLFVKNPARTQSMLLAEEERRKSKNTIGESRLSSSSYEAKERARQGFTCTPPASLTEEQKARLTELNLITAYEGPPLSEPMKKKSWFDIFKSKVRQGENDNHVSWRDLIHKDKS